VYFDLNNLGQQTATSQYDGDGVSITFTSGVPNKPAASLLRAYSTSDYDDQGRVYASHTFSVDPSTGAASTSSLNTLTWENHRGQVIKTVEPGGEVTKQNYDGAGRVTVTYVSDGGGDSSWADAGNVTGDNVLWQTETQYDADSNAILTTVRQRFDSETATGALGTPTTSPLARVSYSASYFDKANRLTASVNVGTNGGAAYTRPSSLPTASDTVLVTANTYNDSGLLDTTDPRGIVE
jgi:YD repeat-containing protein